MKRCKTPTGFCWCPWTELTPASFHPPEENGTIAKTSVLVFFKSEAVTHRQLGPDGGSLPANAWTSFGERGFRLLLFSNLMTTERPGQPVINCSQQLHLFRLWSVFTSCWHLESEQSHQTASFWWVSTETRPFLYQINGFTSLSSAETALFETEELKRNYFLLLWFQLLSDGKFRF